MEVGNRKGENTGVGRRKGNGREVALKLSSDRDTIPVTLLVDPNAMISGKLTWSCGGNIAARISHVSFRLAGSFTLHVDEPKYMCVDYLGPCVQEPS